MQKTVLNFFIKILNDDAATFDLIHAFNNELYLEKNTKCLVFTLPALHQFLNFDLRISYLEFRKIIYQSTLNTDLMPFGAKLVIHQSSNNVDSSLYRLLRI